MQNGGAGRHSVSGWWVMEFWPDQLFQHQGLHLSHHLLLQGQCGGNWGGPLWSHCLWGCPKVKTQIQTHTPSSQTHLTLPQVTVTSEKHVQVKSPGNSEKTKIYTYTNVCISCCIISTRSSFALPVTLFLQDEDCFDGLQLTGGGAQSHQRPTLWGWIQEDWWCPPVSGWPCVQPRHQSRPCPKGTMLQPGRCESPFRVAASGTHTDLEESRWNSPTN